MVVDGQADIFVGDTDGKLILQLTRDQGNDTCPVYSPDGSRLVFCSNRNGKDQLFMMDSTGSDQRLLTDQVSGCLCNPDRPLTWSPDSKWIAFAVQNDPANQTQLVDLYIVRSDGSKVTNLTNSPGYYGGFTWDPDSKTILYMVARENPNIYRVNVNNKKVETLLANPIDAIPAGFSPSGDLLIWDGRNGTISSITLSKNGTEIRQLTSGPGYDKYPAWSRDGQKILFMRREGDSNDVVLMNADGSGQVNLTAGSGVANYWPTISPDGQKIIYITNSQDQWKTMVTNADGSGKIDVTDEFGVVGWISWQP
jgi:Tol biopolymer transport system component